MAQCVTLGFYRFAGFGGRAWALVQMGLARPGLARVPGLRFWKLCGSGTGEGFTPLPNTAVYAILGVWDDAAQARAALSCAPVLTRWAARAAETWTVFLTPTSVRGAWSGVQPFAPEDGPATQAHGTRPLAALTRATVRPRVALRFWGRVPNISTVIGQDPNVLFKIGIGEVPLLHQVTFSIWPDAASMAAFARHGPHAAAISAVRDEGWFNEELYARFTVDDAIGSWNGKPPLKSLKMAPLTLPETA